MSKIKCEQGFCEMCPDIVWIECQEQEDKPCLMEIVREEEDADKSEG